MADVPTIEIANDGDLFQALISFLSSQHRQPYRGCDDHYTESAREYLETYPPDTDKIKNSELAQEIRVSSGEVWRDLSPMEILRQRELSSGLRRTSGRVAPEPGPEQRAVLCSKFLPSAHEVIGRYGSKAFIGRFSRDGEVFLTGTMGGVIRLYKYDNGRFTHMRDVHAQEVGWSIIDIAFSPDQQFIVYSSWCDWLYMVNVHDEHKETHVSLDMRPEGAFGRFCAFSLQFSQDNQEIMAGCNAGDIYIYDRFRGERVLCIEAHEDDVNATCFADNSSQLLYSGSDDGLVKVWDRRSLRQDRPDPAIQFAGHQGGITSIASKGDSRYLISNCKDHSIKLWDIRKPAPAETLEEGMRFSQRSSMNSRWIHQQLTSYKIGAYKPKVPVPGDPSLMTYRGHLVARTLVQCRFSPMHSTGQRYIVTGCASGGVIVYDILTGEVEAELRAQRQVVRDVSWHPYDNCITSASWDGTVCNWTHRSEPCDVGVHTAIPIVEDSDF